MGAATNKILISGISGLLGNNLAAHFRLHHRVLGLYRLHEVAVPGIEVKRCDLKDPGRLGRIMKDFRPDVFIHCAALTDVDGCEADPDAALEANVTATARVAEKAGEFGARLVYISTDSVYSGLRAGYKEIDAANPQNEYGRTKYEGELEAQRASGALVLRTNIFGWNILDKKSLGEGVVGEMEAGRTINGFADVFFSPIYTLELARVIDMAVERGLTGVYNCGGAPGCSKYEFVLKLVRWFGFDPERVTPTSVDDHSFFAKRGKNLTMDVSKIERDLDYKMPTPDYSVERFYRDDRCGLFRRK